MALFPNPPELPIGYPERPASDVTGFTGLNSSQQLFPYSGSIYMASQAVRDSNNSGCEAPIVGKRTSGAWSIPDVAGFQNLIDLTGYSWGTACQCQSGSKLHIFGTTPSPYYLLHITFDTSTNLYSATTDTPYRSGLSNSEPANSPVCAALSNGDVIVAWGGPTSATTGARFSVLSGGVFGAAQTLVATTAGHTRQMRSVVVDASDTAHFLYIDHAGSVLSLYHVSVTMGGSVSTPDLVEAAPANYTFGPGALFNGDLTFTGCKGSDPHVYLWESNPSIIAWTKKTVAARTNDFSSANPCPVVVSATALYIAWPENNPTPYPAQTATVRYSIYDGSTFTAKAVAWDAGDNQYPGAMISPPGDVQVLFPSLQFSGGKLRLLGYSEFDPSYDETELYLEVAIGASSGYRNRVY